MQLKSLNNNWKLFSRIFLYIAMAISITIISITLFFQVFYENAIVKLINTSVQNSLRQISYSASYMRDSALTNAKQIFFLNNVDKLLHFTSLSYLDYSKGLTSLNQLLATTPYIHSVYLYNGKSGLFLTDISPNPIEKGSFKDSFAVRQIENSLKDRKFIPYARKISVDINAPDSSYKTNAYTFFYYSNSKNPNILDSAVIINIKESWIRDIIKSIRLDSDSEIIIVDDKGMIVSSSDIERMFQDISNEDYFRKLVSSENKNDYFKAGIGKTDYLVSYITLDDIKWKFIQLTPYSNIISTYSSYKKVSLLIAVIILCLGILISRIVSGRIYSPINSIREKLEDMEEKKRNLLYSQKQEYLNSLLQGTFNHSAKAMEENFNYFSLQINKTGAYQLVILKIENFKSFCNEYGLMDRNIFIFGILNIASEIFGDLTMNECVCSGGKYINIIFNIDSGLDLGHDILSEKIRNIRDSVYSAFKIDTAAVVTSTVEGLENICKIYEEGIDLLNYFLFSDSSKVIFYDQIPGKDSLEYRYPLNEEEKMIEYLRMGNHEKAYEVYIKIINCTKEYTFNVFQTTILQIALAINSLSISLAKNGSHDIYYNFRSFVNELGELEKTDDINALFESTFKHIAERSVETSDERSRKLLNAIDMIIDRNYTDPNLSIESISETVKLSTVYLGQIYKKLTSRSISETITEHRLEKARDLLRNTRLPVTDVVERCGFISTAYFYPLFKKYHGVTPNDYRKSVEK